MSDSRKRFKLNHQDSEKPVSGLPLVITVREPNPNEEKLNELTMANAQLAIKNERNKQRLGEAISQHNQLLSQLTKSSETTAELNIKLTKAQGELLNLRMNAETDQRQIKLLVENKRLTQQIKDQAETSQAAYQILEEKFSQLSAQHKTLANNYLLLSQAYLNLTTIPNSNNQTSTEPTRLSQYSGTVFKPVLAKRALPVDPVPLGPLPTHPLPISSSAFKIVKK